MNDVQRTKLVDELLQEPIRLQTAQRLLNLRSKRNNAAAQAVISAFVAFSFAFIQGQKFLRNNSYDLLGIFVALAIFVLLAISLRTLFRSQRDLKKAQEASAA